MTDKALRMRRRFSDFLMSACALMILLAGMVLYDGQFRQELALRMNGTHASTEVVAAGSRARDIAGAVVEAAKAQTRERTPMVIFVVAATVLTIFMLRT